MYWDTTPALVIDYCQRQFLHCHARCHGLPIEGTQPGGEGILEKDTDCGPTAKEPWLLQPDMAEKGGSGSCQIVRFTYMGAAKVFYLRILNQIIMCLQICT